ncbi:MAG: AAA family ATPase [Syntrophorhabdaceae bacterium]|nr:AAA family ATPase [Syntrophorhabdaceae bacterium]
MRLLRLELFGFKSFLNRTVFQFGDGITSIVGPNGCGKSNIVDAIVWALGERGTKSLRIKDMGDVVFHGSNGKRPVNIAEVSVDLTDGSREINVKRRIYRDGTNEYYLNGNIVRLKDIHDTFLGTGVGANTYAIIEQGKIENFAQMKPLERRVVIEEASGITRFEEKKREAIGRMDEVSTNLDRVEDIYSEVTKSFEKAEGEWQRWKAYKELADKLHEIDRHILLQGYSRLTKRIGKIIERQQEIEEEARKEEEGKEKLKQEMGAKDAEFSLTDNIIRQLEIDIKGLEKDMEGRLVEIDYINEEKTRLEKQGLALAEEKAALMSRADSYKNDIADLGRQVQAYGLDLTKEEGDELRLRETTEGLKARIEEQEEKVEDGRTKLFVAMSELTDIRNKLSEIERIAQERQKREERRIQEERRLREISTELEVRCSSLKETLGKRVQEKLSALSGESETLKESERCAKELDEAKNALERLKGEKQAKEDVFRQLGGYDEAAEPSGGDTGKLINLIRVAEERERALERFFASELEYHVLTARDPAGIAEAVEKGEGNYVFFPQRGIFTLNGGDVEINVQWIEAVQDALLRIEQGEEGVFMNDTVFVDSRGFIIREKDDKGVDLKKFKEKVRLEKELKELATTVQGQEVFVRDLQSRYDATNSAYVERKRYREEKEKEAGDVEKEIIVVETELKTSTEKLQELSSRLDVLDETAQASAAQLLQKKALLEKEKEDIESDMVSLKEGLTAVKQDYEASLSAWHEITIGLERRRNALRMLHENIEQKGVAIQDIAGEVLGKDKEMERLGAAIGECAGKISKFEKEYEDLKSDSERYLTRLEELKTALGNLHAEKHALQERIDAVNKAIDKIRSKREGADRDIAILTDKKDQITERLLTVYHIENPEGVELPPNPRIEEERAAISGQIADMGEINFRAEKEYLELKERASFLAQQKEDLKNAMDSLKKTIAKIDNLSRELFNETFEKINDSFKKFTEMLFKGGKGYLSVNQENGGIEMFVQPAGKKVIRMELLSGGEKALISLALLLSIMDTKPSPFALMDEIDAPLDDANLSSLIEIIRGMSIKTQIVFITHNRITMESSNTIYGITMEEEGISKTVSVRL